MCWYNLVGIAILSDEEVAISYVPIVGTRSKFKSAS